MKHQVTLSRYLRQAIATLRLKTAVFLHGTPLAASPAWLELSRAEAQRRHGRVNDVRKAKAALVHDALGRAR